MKRNWGKPLNSIGKPVGSTIIMLIGATLLPVGCLCSSGNSSKELETVRGFSLDKSQAIKDLEEFTKQPHPFGSPRQKQLQRYLINRIRQHKIEPYIQSFSSKTPKPLDRKASGPMSLTQERSGANIVALLESKNSNCGIFFGSHYDTKTIPGLDYVGANDSGSSSVLLLGLVNYLKNSRLRKKCSVGFVWFDGEESVLAGWNDGQNRHPAKIQDNTYGSRYAASKLTPCGNKLCWNFDKKQIPFTALILLDMVGSKELKITRDTNSNRKMLEYLDESSKLLGYQKFLARTPKAIDDDHLPFARRGIPSLNIIDFENLQYWHAPGDKIEHVSVHSMTIAGQLALAVASQVAKNPKAFLK